jgi:hypothetical protein
MRRSSVIGKKMVSNDRLAFQPISGIDLKAAVVLLVIG